MIGSGEMASQRSVTEEFIEQTNDEGCTVMYTMEKIIIMIFNYYIIPCINNSNPS